MYTVTITHCKLPNSSSYGRVTIKVSTTEKINLDHPPLKDFIEALITQLNLSEKVKLECPHLIRQGKKGISVSYSVIPIGISLDDFVAQFEQAAELQKSKLRIYSIYMQINGANGVRRKRKAEEDVAEMSRQNKRPNIDPMIIKLGILLKDAGFLQQPFVCSLDLVLSAAQRAVAELMRTKVHAVSTSAIPAASGETSSVINRHTLWGINAAIPIFTATGLQAMPMDTRDERGFN
jgi:hypothetical protein